MRPLVLVGVLAIAAIIGTWLYVSVPQSESYMAAERLVRSDSQVQAAVGDVQGVKWRFWDDSYSVDNRDGGVGSYSFDVSGSTDRAVVAIEVRGAKGVWKATKLTVKFPGGRTERLI